ncbi:YbaK/EbsC family protein [Anaerococcus urinomassiliensis]|uniref:YbaK/EbsC family protein n=1 Tax=Anaerococcus urinomassiliensis TaxID=1745712 RepID=UPI00093D28A2|nr:YbaK/EbsC family protein [Anaerococcus urinomassiliensis]
MSNRDKLFEIFDQLDIKYDIVEHPAAESTEEADRYIEGKDGARTKNLFMANRKDKQYYLIVMDDQKMISMKDYNKLLDEKGMHFVQPEKILEILEQEVGIISVFGLINTDEDIKVIFDKDMIDENEIMTFHPDDNTKTVFLKNEDVFKFVKNAGYDYQIFDFQPVVEF